MKRVFLPLLWALVSSHAWANGEATYNQVCAVCHAQGLAGAPKAGDAKAWGKLIKEGQINLTADGYAGVRAMPAKGGKPELGVPEFADAVVHMANLAGANWKTPDEAMLKKIDQRIAKRAQTKK
jgi:cytochrome c5